MDSWHATFLGRRHLPREVTAFEVEVFFQFSAEEARIIEERRRPELKLGLALQIGFLRMSGRLLDAVRMVPPLLWRYGGIWVRDLVLPPRTWPHCARCTGAPRP
jgi:Domain of unknown function (DUF4158)